MRNKKEKIKAIYNEDLDKLLQQTGQYDDFIEGSIHCKYCLDKITKDNISVMVPHIVNNNLKLEFCCNKPNCLKCYKEDNG